ncbi:MAG: hypothetical protein IJ488_05995 [Clostridia bacterium]|nr:hypothetical protein [Clostridia bacterium]
MKRKLLLITVTIATLCSFFALSASAEGEGEPVSVPIPQPDSTVYTYNGEEQVYNLPESEYYDIVGNKKTDAGEYTVSVNLKDTESSVWSDGSITTKEYSFVIAKAVCSPDKITFEDKTVVCDSMVHSIYALFPKGIEAEYTGNGQVDPGVYTVTVKFKSDNYEPIPDRTATLTVNRAALREDSENPDNSGVLLWKSEDSGFAPDFKISVDASDTDASGLYSGDNIFFVKSYRLSVLKGETLAEIDTTVRIQLPIPEYLLKVPFKLVSASGDSLTELEYARFNKHIVYETDELCEVAFVYSEVSLTPVIVTLSIVIGVLLIAFFALAFFTHRNTRLMSFSPVLFGVAVSSDELTVLIILSIIALLLLVLDILALIRFLKPVIQARRESRSAKIANEDDGDKGADTLSGDENAIEGTHSFAKDGEE